MSTSGTTAAKIVGIVLLAAGAAFVVHQQIGAIALGQATENLQRSRIVVADTQADALQTLQLRASALAEDPAFVDYVVQSLQPSAAMGGGIDRASISDLLNARRQGYDVAIVLDAQGMPAALDGVLLKDKTSIQRDPLVTEAMSSGKPTQGAWVYDGQLLWVSVNPLLRGGIAQAGLIAVKRAGDAFAVTVAQHSGVSAGVLVGTGKSMVIAAQHGLPGWAIQTLPDVATAIPASETLPAAGRALEVPGLDGDQPAWAVPVAVSNGRALVISLAEVRPHGAVSRAQSVLYAVIAALALLCAIVVLPGARRRADS